MTESYSIDIMISVNTLNKELFCGITKSIWLYANVSLSKRDGATSWNSYINYLQTGQNSLPQCGGRRDPGLVALRLIILQQAEPRWIALRFRSIAKEAARKHTVSTLKNDWPMTDKESSPSPSFSRLVSVILLVVRSLSPFACSCRSFLRSRTVPYFKSKSWLPQSIQVSGPLTGQPLSTATSALDMKRRRRQQRRRQR